MKPVLVSVGVWSGDVSVSVTDDTSSVLTATAGSSEKGTDSADSTSFSGIELSLVELGSSATADSGFGTGAV